MKDLRRARRVGACAILSALVLRLWAAGLPGWIETALKNANTTLKTDLETGREVRFSPSLEVFSPDFVESPPPFIPEATEPPIPSFSGEEEVELYYAVQKDPDIAALLDQPLEWDLAGEEPTVLILHTHSTESYTQAGENYVESASWRTLDENFNMISIGSQVAQILRSSDISVVHHQELNDYPSYNGSYTRARKVIREYLEAYPSICLILDLHRDASGSDGRQMRTLAQVNGQPSAQLMVVLGTNHEAYEENLSFGLKLHAQLERQAPGIMRPLQLRAQRFNQDLCKQTLLIEVGAAGNSHAEAITAAEQLAQAIVALAKGAQ